LGSIYDVRIAYAKDIIRFRSMLGKVTIDGVGILVNLREGQVSPMLYDKVERFTWQIVEVLTA
jgi:hypothetical protein